jgi:hypothetical protein
MMREEPPMHEKVELLEGMRLIRQASALLIT